MKQYNVLYVYGYGSSNHSGTYMNLRKYLAYEKFNVYCINYRQENPIDALEDINNAIIDYQIDFVVGSSLGGYLTLNLRGVSKLVLNPCVHPENELELLKNPDNTPAVPEDIVNAYKEYAKEHDVWENWDSEERLCTVALMGTQDELFGMKYLNEISSNVKWTYEVEQSHHSSASDVKNILAPYIEKWFYEISPNVSAYFSGGVHV